jgi:hypothetical protein
LAPTVDLLLRYAHEQGIAQRRVTADAVFPAGIMTKVIV